METDHRPDQAPAARRILLIEDNELDARTMVRALTRSSQIDVERTIELQAGLEALRAEAFDCVLLDLSLPDSEGIDGVRAVVAAAGHCPTVVLTGLDDPATAMQAVAAGAQDYLVKGTATPEIVERSVRYAIARFWTENRLVAAERRLEGLETREQIARDLHDTVIQRLFATGMSLQAGLRTAPDPLKDRLNDSIDEIDTAIRELRQAIFGLHAGEDNDFALELERVIDPWREPLGITPVVQVTVDPQLVGEVRHDVLAACREALANISRHTFATSVVVMVERHEAVVELVVSHSGELRSADESLADASGGRGLDNLRQRAAVHGGDVGLTVSDGSSELRFTVVAPID